MKKGLVAAILVILLFWLAGCVNKEGKTLGELQEEALLDETGDDPKDASETDVIEEETGEEAELDSVEESEHEIDETEETKTDVIIESGEGVRMVENETGEAEVDVKVQDNLKPVKILMESSTFGTAEGGREEEDVSVFSNVRCRVRGPAGDRAMGSSYPDDIISFTLHNRDNHDYFLGYYRKGLEFDDIPQYSLKILINGRKIDDMEEKCGTLVVKAGETFECRDVKTVIKTGESFTGRPNDNKLEVGGVYMSSKTIFICDDS